MNNKSGLLCEYRKFLKLAHHINSFNIRSHTLRKLRYDFENYYKTENPNTNLLAKLKFEYERLNRIAIVQNLNVPYETFKYNISHNDK